MKTLTQQHKERSYNGVSTSATNDPQAFGLSIHNRPEAALQRKIRHQSHNSLAVAQARIIQSRLNASPQVSQLKALQARATNFSTGHGPAVVQRIKDNDGKKLTTKKFWDTYKSMFKGTGVGYADVKYDLEEDGWHDSTVKKYLAHQALVDDDSRSNGDDATYGGARTVGDSGALAKGRYNRSKRKSILAFAAWKKAREAQHLIPACLHKDHPALTGIVDLPENGMMLPATYAATNTKPTHRQPKHRDHRKYTKNVSKLMGKVKKRTNKKALDQKHLKLVMNALRAVNKNNNYHYIDDIPFKKFKKQWNAQNSTLTL